MAWWFGMRSYVLLWSKQTTLDPSHARGRMDLSARKIERIKHWSYVGTSLTLTWSYGERSSPGKTLLEFDLLHTTWPTPGWLTVGEMTPQASVLPLSVMILEMITCRRNWWIGTSIVCLWWKPHCLWLQLSPLPPLWNASPLFSFHASCFSF